jgi:hypothetical protein
LGPVEVLVVVERRVPAGDRRLVLVLPALLRADDFRAADVFRAVEGLLAPGVLLLLVAILFSSSLRTKDIRRNSAARPARRAPNMCL